MNVPFLDLAPQNAPLRAEIDAAIARVIASGRFILGPEVEAFERELADLLGVAHAIGVSSGTDALLACLMALGVGPGHEVVTTAYSFFATAGVIARVGATPVFVDIEPGTFNLDPAQAAAAVGPRTRAVIPVHLFGRPAALPDVGGVPIIEDAAQAIGAAPLAGLAGCLSFFPSKNVGAFGDAGAVYTNDDDLAAKIRLLRSHGAHPRYTHHVVGGNFRLDELQAAVLRVKLPHLERWTAARRANAARYRELFAVANVPDITLPEDHPEHIYNQFVIRAGARRDALRERLSRAGVATEVYYPSPLHRQPCFRETCRLPGPLPHAEAASRTSLALPIYPGLSPTAIGHVAAYSRGQDPPLQ